MARHDRSGRNSGPRMKGLAIFLIAGALTGCGGDGASTNTASAENPSSASPTSRTSLPTAAQSATLNWLPPTQNTDGSALTDLTGYKILYGKNSQSLSQAVNITNPSVNSYVIENLTSGTWYFIVKAITSNGAESDASNMANKTV